MTEIVDAETVRRLYTDEGLSRDKIALMLKVPHSAVTTALKRAGVSMRPPVTPTMVSELTSSDPIPTHIEQAGGKAITKHQIRLTLKLSYLLGWIIGDGYVNKREIDAIVSSKERPLLEHSFKTLLESFGKVFVVPRHGAYILRCNSTELARILCTDAGRRYWKNVEFILDSPRFAAAFIAGFWDADGGIFRECNGTIRVHLYNSNLALLKKVADSLSIHFGIGVTIYRRKTPRVSPKTNIRARSDRFDLYVPSKHNYLWARYIGRYLLLPWKKP